MLVIVNVSPPNTPTTGINQYEVRVNQKVIASFEHDRQYMNAAQCLRDAADALEKARLQEHENLITALCSKLDTFYHIEQNIPRFVKRGAENWGVKKVNKP
jgi:DNA-directed RNA polymerase specialized sigma54-like protein